MQMDGGNIINKSIMTDSQIHYILLPVLLIVLFYIIRDIKRNYEQKRELERIRLEYEHRCNLIRSVTPLDRGTKSERDLVFRLLNNGIPANNIFHDLLIVKGNGEFSQVDIVVPTKVGILVFEVKDYSGWIFGNGGHEQWTQVMAYGRDKYRFYNPIRQNSSHIRSLQKELKLSNNITIYSIIVFYGECELKELNYIPNNTFVIKPHRLKDVLTDILDKNPEAPFTDKWEIIRLLKCAVERGKSKNETQQHISNIEDKFGKHRIYD